jgi:hypothetical protein
LYDGLLFSKFTYKKGLCNIACFLILCNSIPVILLLLIWIHLFVITEFIDRTNIMLVLLFAVTEGFLKNSAFTTGVIAWRSNAKVGHLLLPDFTKLPP